jgi:hypothetical protein
VNTTISAACSLVAARTAAVASASVCRQQHTAHQGVQHCQQQAIHFGLTSATAAVATTWKGTLTDSQQRK